RNQIRPQAANRSSERRLVLRWIPSSAALSFENFTTRENLALLSSSTATTQSAAVTCCSVRTCRHISGNLKYLFMLPPSRHISCQRARTPSATSLFRACPCTDRDSARPSPRCQAQIRPAPPEKLPPWLRASRQYPDPTDRAGRRSEW